MSWVNHGMGLGTWQIDHIIPIMYPGADGGNPTIEEVAKRLYWTNTQPLWTVDNIAKGNRFIGRDRPQPELEKAETVWLTDDDIDALLG